MHSSGQFLAVQENSFLLTKTLVLKYYELHPDAYAKNQGNRQTATSEPKIIKEARENNGLEYFLTSGEAKMIIGKR